jgi:hypothetical protein
MWVHGTRRAAPGAPVPRLMQRPVPRLHGPYRPVPRLHRVCQRLCSGDVRRVPQHVEPRVSPWSWGHTRLHVLGPHEAPRGAVELGPRVSPACLYRPLGHASIALYARPLSQRIQRSARGPAASATTRRRHTHPSAASASAATRCPHRHPSAASASAATAHTSESVAPRHPRTSARTGPERSSRTGRACAGGGRGGLPGPRAAPAQAACAAACRPTPRDGRQRTQRRRGARRGGARERRRRRVSRSRGAASITGSVTPPPGPRNAGPRRRGA